MYISDDIKYIGVTDRKIDLFESQFPVENGMTYNSYVIMDDKIAVMDTVDEGFGSEWLTNLENILEGKTPDYLVVHHMESDHSSNIDVFMDKYPTATIVSSMQAFNMIKNFFGKDYSDRRLIVKEGSTLNLGKHELTFIGAPMVHWPEVTLSYDSYDKVLFSADAFGKFGAIDPNESWDDEARRYYIGIVGKFGTPVQNLLKKASKLDIQTICPLHGPVLSENLEHYISLYNTWSSYQPEKDGIVIAYSSVYGHTEKAVKLLEEKLKQNGQNNVVIYDLSRCDISRAISDAFCYDRLVLATTTYNGDIFPSMYNFIHHLISRDFKNRTIGLIENGSWACTAAKVMQSMLSNSKNITYAENKVTILSSVDNNNIEQINALALELSK